MLIDFIVDVAKWLVKTYAEAFCAFWSARMKTRIIVATMLAVTVAACAVHPDIESDMPTKVSLWAGGVLVFLVMAEICLKAAWIVICDVWNGGQEAYQTGLEQTGGEAMRHREGPMHEEVGQIRRIVDNGVRTGQDRSSMVAAADGCGLDRAMILNLVTEFEHEVRIGRASTERAKRDIGRGGAVAWVGIMLLGAGIWVESNKALVSGVIALLAGGLFAVRALRRVCQSKRTDRFYGQN